MADDNKTFQQRYLEAKAEAQKYEVASGVYMQRLQEKLTGLIEAQDAMLKSLNDIKYDSVRELVLGIIPCPIATDRLEDIKYLQSLKVALDTAVNELEKAGNAALG